MYKSSATREDYRCPGMGNPHDIILILPHHSLMAKIDVCNLCSGIRTREPGEDPANFTLYSRDAQYRCHKKEIVWSNIARRWKCSWYESEIPPHCRQFSGVVEQVVFDIALHVSANTSTSALLPHTSRILRQIRNKIQSERFFTWCHISALIPLLAKYIAPLPITAVLHVNCNMRRES